MPRAMTAAALRQPPRPLPPWLAVKTLFEQLVELPAAERQQAMARAGAAPEIVAEVIELLGQHEAEERQGGAFLGRPALLQQQASEVDDTIDRRGERLGPWRITAPLGAGGMGRVWEARRDDGAYDARVAVKVLRGDGPAAGPARALLDDHFAQEQRLLARLNHPHIARLLDAGRTADGAPYFVLEAVDGQPIDAACRGLDLAGRLKLFLQLADAVAHAHRQQLTHRDLKPANVLVTPDGQVKLLDFGIAQALDHAPAHARGPRPLTPGYASPEQVRGEPVTAASDIYSLGVVLHVLLTGRRPYGAQDRSTVHGALRAVLEQPPVPPSRTPLPDGAAAAAGADLGVDRRQLAGDIDAIVAKALAKPVAARYASVEPFAADLRAVLEGLPVSARPHTPAYLASRFVRRHRVAVAASALALLAVAGGLGATAWQARDAVAALSLAALVAGLGASTWQARRARAARDEARERLGETQTLVRDIVMRYADAVTYLPGGLRMKAELIQDTLATMDRLALGSPGDAALAGERAKALVRLADLQLPGQDATLDAPDEAQRNAEAALALFPDAEPAHRDDPAFYLWWSRAMRVRCIGLRHAGDPLASLRMAERMRDFLQAALLRFPGNRQLLSDYGSTLVGIGQAHDTWQYASLGNPEQALAAFRAAEAVYESLLAGDAEDHVSLYQLGTLAGAQEIVMLKAGRLDEAVAHGRRAVALRDRSLALQPQNVAYRDGAAGERNNFAWILLERRRPEDVAEALGVTARCEALIAALYSEDPALPTWAQRRRWFALHRGRALLAAGQVAEALPRLRLALEAMTGDVSGTLLRRRGWCRLELARAERAAGDTEAAREAARLAARDLEAFVAAQPDDRDAVRLLVELRAFDADPDATTAPR